VKPLALKSLLLVAVATLCFASTELKVSRKALAIVEGAMNDKFRTITTDPYDLLGTARGTYLEGYGALFTVELQLVYLTPPSPFRAAYSPQELTTMHDRKVKKLPVMKATMRDLMANAGSALETMPANERVSMEAILWRYSWEDSTGLPQRIFMTAEKGKILQAQTAHADLATVIEEREQ
jgi:hypothetical protein